MLMTKRIISIRRPYRRKESTLAHLHIPGLCKYQDTDAVQHQLVDRFLEYRRRGVENGGGGPIPQNTVITMEMSPVYTLGRRQGARLSLEQQRDQENIVGRDAVNKILVDSSTNKRVFDDGEMEYLSAGGKAAVVKTDRGGQTTFHGPGQLVAYPILDLKGLKLSSRRYISILEKTIIATLDRYGINGFTTNDTGVWVNNDAKIASIGVHLQRFISSHGICINISNNLWWFDRIIACGLLPPKHATNMLLNGCDYATVEGVGRVFVYELAKQLNCRIEPIYS